MSAVVSSDYSANRHSVLLRHASNDNLKLIAQLLWALDRVYIGWVDECQSIFNIHSGT